MKYFIFFLLIIARVSSVLFDDQRRLPYQNPDLFQGDILGIDPYDRNVIPEAKYRWPNKEVPYVIDSSIGGDSYLINIAMEDYHKHTCLRFVPRITQKNYIKIFSGNGCYSNIGMDGSGEQPLSLGYGCLFKGIIMHELGHAIGFFHEQNRSDRDQYLTIFWDKIKEDRKHEFVLLKPHENLLLTPFDYDSLMIYGNYAFSADRYSMTMAAKNGQKLREPMAKSGMSPSDIERIKIMYDC